MFPRLRKPTPPGRSRKPTAPVSAGRADVPAGQPSPTRSRRPHPASLLALLLPALALSACGNADTPVTTGTYAGDRRQKRSLSERRPAALRGSALARAEPRERRRRRLSAGPDGPQRKLEPGQEWFAVFIQVYNHHSTPLPAATDVTITDTQHNSYSPIDPGLERTCSPTAAAWSPPTASFRCPARSPTARATRERSCSTRSTRPRSKTGRWWLHIVDPGDSGRHRLRRTRRLTPARPG